jgi:outer membrane protein OmpA-like peptidoglycan-associated protein
MKRVIISIAILMVSFLSINSQNVNSMYFLNEWSHRNTFNPAFAPEYGQLSLPILGGIQLNLKSSTGLSNYIFKNNNELVTFLHPSVKSADFLSLLDPNISINQGLKLDLFSFGFYTERKAFWSFDVSIRENFNVNLPSDFFKFAKVGMEKYTTNTYNLQNLGFEQSNIGQVALGYSKSIGPKFRFGINAKFLVGLSYESVKYSKFNLTLAQDKYEFDAVGNLQIRADYLSLGKDSTNTYYDPSKLKFDLSKLKPAGMGGAIDLGFTYKPFKRLTLAAAVNDIGYIKWNKSAIQNGIANSKVTFTGFTNISVDSLKSIDDQIKSLTTNATNLIKFKEDAAPSEDITENLPYTINASAEFSVFANPKHDILFGALYHSYNTPTNKINELVGAVTLKPLSWLTLSGTYEFLRKDVKRYGLAFNFSPRWINIWVATDFAETRLDSKMYYPVDKFDVSLSLGASLVIRNPKDKDKDGVVDRLDKCEKTPYGVFVDKKGCPVGTDGDGVPDYLDQCSKTPKEAYNKIDEKGCPLDSDNDSIPDYLDKSPNTPLEARGKLDEQGLPKDTDRDGIFDYLDKCPDTPSGVEVDSVGCPLDKDGDGVADYLDLCPSTAPQARGMVDKNGCPLDTDGDGVSDYLDLCPNTPVEAFGFVDMNGCVLDSDDDSIPNYLDKCPNTPVVARGKIDNKGCPLDTDGDGIYDYLDNCPNASGLAINNGCPEIKKEVKTLFQKALQGIQFEPGKFILKPTSFAILDQIANVLIANPTYLLDVRGHTDNVGDSISNLTLSAARASAVRDYLINKGVAEKRITSQGFGDTKPVGDNKTPVGKALNRRVEFVVTFEETSVN